MTEAQKKSDATRWLVVELAEDETSLKVVGVEGNEGDARGVAETCARNNEGARFGVFQKVGTAQIERKVAWKGATA